MPYGRPSQAAGEMCPLGNYTGEMPKSDSVDDLLCGTSTAYFWTIIISRSTHHISYLFHGITSLKYASTEGVVLVMTLNSAAPEGR